MQLFSTSEFILASQSSRKKLFRLNTKYKTKSSFVKRTLDKIKRYLTYIDKYYNIKLFNSNIKQNKKNTYSVRGINFKNNSGFTDVLYSA